MRLKFYLFTWLLFANSILDAQPLPCITDEMTPECSDACVVCDINGFTGRNTSDIPGQRPSDFCTTINHNITWIAFIAGTPELSLLVGVTNCRRGRGLEVGIYESLDCVNTRLISNCDGNMGPNRTTRFTVTEPLVVGQYYYFVMDGNGGDECDYTVTVETGSTAVGAMDDINFIDGDTQTCPGDTATYEVPYRIGANFQQWFLDGQLVLEQDTSFEMVWEIPGTYNLCYTAFNVCDTIPPVCKTIRVQPLPPIIYRDTLCQNECYYFETLDTTICLDGRTVLSQKIENGCTEEYWIDLEYLPTPFSNLDLEFCFGDSVKIGSEAYFETGNYQAALISDKGCDSIVNLTISTFLCDINGGFADDILDCAGEADGRLEFVLLDGTYPYDYNWEEKTGSGLIGNGISTTPGDVVVIENLPAGIYSVTVTDADNSRGVFIGQVFEPNPILADFVVSDYFGFGVSCPELEDGFISLNVNGGTGNYMYKWSDDNSISASRTDLAAGNYSISITDDNGCELILMPEINAPQDLVSNLVITEPSCVSAESGILSIENISGGAGFYEVSFNGGNFSNVVDFGNLPVGDYDFVLRDANGCEVQIDTFLSEPNDLTLAISGESEIFLGDSILLSSIVNDPNVTFEWSNGAAISCPDCPNTYVRPFQNSTYILTITRADQCSQSASIEISLIDRKRVYVPSAFSPNNDGINDFLSIFTGPEVIQVLEFNVFGRWGEQVYNSEKFNPQISTQGWDGTFRGKKSQTGVYTWYAKIEFIDGIVETYEGDVTLFN